MNKNLTDFEDVSQLSHQKWGDLSCNSHYGQLYHISELPVKCPRCSNFGELIEDVPIRSLYRCRDCGIFAKLTPKKRLHGLRQSIAQGELTTALEILESAGHEGTDAIDALNLYRGVVSHA